MKTIGKNAIRALVAAGLMAGLCFMGQGSAEARGSGGIAGSPAHGSQSNCFQEDFGGVRNVCGGDRNFVLPAILDNSGNVSFQIGMQAPRNSTQKVTCKAWSKSEYGSVYRWGTRDQNTVFTGVIEKLHVGVYAPGWGATWAYCTMQNNTLILNYHY